MSSIFFSNPLKTFSHSFDKRLFVALIILLVITGCGEISYYSQAVNGHLDILNRKKKIETLLVDPETPPELVKKLKLIESVRQFAAQELSLPAAKSYNAYSDVGRPYVTAVVTAANRLKLEPYEWCFLFVGCVGYRGYFDKSEATAYAQELAKQNWDVNVGEVRAYSTLNWLNNDFMPDYFKDPVLNTFLDQSETSIIRTLIHEMAHQVVFVSGDTAFNESFAVFVEQEGLRQYLNAHYENADNFYKRYLLKKEDRKIFIEIIQSYYDQFEQLYSSDLPEKEKLEKKVKLFEDMRQTYKNREPEFKVLSYSRWFSQPLNNSHLLSIRRYHSFVPVFAFLFKEQKNNWPKFFEKVKEIADFPSEKRKRFINTCCNSASES